MHGRCDNDPLDIAEEVCGLCGGEFCQECLITTSARNARFACKPCAVNGAGLRPGRKTNVATKRSIRSRRKVLQTTVDGREKDGFLYFDDPASAFFEDKSDSSEQDAEQSATDVDSRSETRETRRRFGRLGGRRKADPAEAENAADQEIELSAKSLAVLAHNDDLLEEAPQTTPTIENRGPSATELLGRLKGGEETSDLSDPDPVEQATTEPAMTVDVPSLPTTVPATGHMRVKPTVDATTAAWIAQTTGDTNGAGFQVRPEKLQNPAPPTALVTSQPQNAQPQGAQPQSPESTEDARVDLSTSPFASTSASPDGWVPPALRG